MRNLKSIEQMARECLERYMRPLIINGKVVMNGWSANIAAKKAAAAYPNFAAEIYKIAAEISN